MDSIVYETKTDLEALPLTNDANGGVLKGIKGIKHRPRAAVYVVIILLLLVGIGYSVHTISKDSVVNTTNDSSLLESEPTGGSFEDLYSQDVIPRNWRPNTIVPTGHFGKIAIVTLAIGGKFNDASKVSIINKVEYAEKHGYSFITPNSTEHDVLVWEKVSSFKSIINDYDWVWLLDLDAYITNMDIRVEDLIQKSTEMHLGEELEVIFAFDFPWMIINAGSMLLKSDKYTEGLIDKWMGYEKDNLLLAEQEAFGKMWLDNYNGLSKHTAVIPMRYLNSYPAEHDNRMAWYSGDYVAHFPGSGKSAIAPFIVENINAICKSCSLQDSDESFQPYRIKQNI